MGKTAEEIRRILEAHKEKLHQGYYVKEIGIFGSYLRGEQKKQVMWISWLNLKDPLD
jgi:predicted nucleotidyltransferase